MSGGISVRSRTAYILYTIADWFNARSRRKRTIAVRGVGAMTKVPVAVSRATGSAAFKKEIQ